MKKMIIIITIALLLAAAGWRLNLFSGGKPRPFLDADGKVIAGSISEKCFIEVNGDRQGMFISSVDSSKPVLLFIHGGPGMPEYAISRRYPLVLEKYFTVCWWEHRGAGISYHDGIPPGTMNFSQFTDDAICVTNYLRKRFRKDKIYLMAHSGGTVTGIMAAAKAPELYHAYFAVSQITNQKESEKLAYTCMVEKFTEAGNTRMLRKLGRYNTGNLNTPSYYTMRDIPMHRLGIGTTRKMKSVFTGIFLPVMSCEAYTLRERINIWRGKSFNTKHSGLWDKVVSTDLTREIKELRLPVYFFSGIYDYTVSYTLAKQFHDRLQAPVKAFYTFTNSAHSPMFEEPEEFGRILVLSSECSMP